MVNSQVTRELILQIPRVHACYADHFPGNPIVPGALLLKWIMVAIKNEFDRDVVRIKQIKFLATVKPGDQLQLAINAGAASGQLLVVAHLGETLVLKGAMDIGAEVDPAV